MKKSSIIKIIVCTLLFYILPTVVAYKGAKANKPHDGYKGGHVILVFTPILNIATAIMFIIEADATEIFE